MSARRPPADPPQVTTLLGAKLYFAALALIQAMAQRMSCTAAAAGASLALRDCTATTLIPATKNGPKRPEELGRSPRIQPPPWSWRTTGVGLSDGTWYTS